jgi:predicted TPR repeat methyltransferase
VTPTSTDPTVQADARERAAAATCRSCGAEGLVPVLDLGSQPLANRLRTEEELGEDEPRHPLDVAACAACSLVQLTHSVPPEELFGDYPYFSSVIPTLVAHAKEIAERTIAERGLGPESLAMELASNDGYLLQHYRDAGVPVLGVDPARNIAAVAEERGIPTRCAFFGQAVAAELVAEGHRPDVVHANNVMAHVPELNSFVAGIATLLGDHGRLITESPYLKDLLDHVEFDTIYHEHLCYYSLTALDRLFARHGLVIEDVERLAIHGGTLRMTVGAAAVCERGPAVLAMLEAEQGWGVDDPATYAAFGERVRQLGRDLRDLVDRLREDGETVVAYGASAKGSTLLNTFGLGRDRLAWIADASPHKQGRYAPGTGLPIVGPERLLEERPGYVLLLAWNFAEEIMGQQQAYRDAGGKFIVPVPAPAIV